MAHRPATEVRMMAWQPFSKSKAIRPRVAPRHDAVGLRCGIGDLVDLSTSGMRVQGTGKCALIVGQLLPLVISNGGQNLRVQAQVAWVTKPALGKGQFQAGLRFIDLRPGLTAALSQFAQFGCVNTSSELGGGDAGVSDTGHPGGAASSGGHTANTARPQQQAMRVDVENLYANLGVSMDASDADIKKAFHQLAMKYHPDRNIGEDTTERFAMLNKSYMVLKDPETRRRYDDLLKRSA